MNRRAPFNEAGAALRPVAYVKKVHPDDECFLLIKRTAISTIIEHFKQLSIEYFLDFSTY
jgi:hypothetical protein